VTLYWTTNIDCQVARACL